MKENFKKAAYMKHSLVYCVMVFFLMTLHVFISCNSNVILGIPRDEVLEKLKSQNIDFILEADPDEILNLNKLHPSAPFYIGLLVKAADDPVRAAVLFEKALESPSEQVRKASAEQLLPFLVKKTDNTSLPSRIQKLSKENDLKTDASMQTLNNAALYMLGRYREINPPDAEDFLSWNLGFYLMAQLHIEKNPGEAQKQEIRNYFLAGPMDEARIWAFEELQKISPLCMTAAEMTAIEGRIAVYRSSFNEGIERFKTVIEEDQALFFVYIDLLHDLGRAYQFTKYQQEGIERFSEWETWLRAGAEIGTSILNIDVSEARYRLLYFIGRSESQGEHYDAAIQAFAEALKFTSDADQQDACIWYILNAVLLEHPSEVKSYLHTYVPQWNDDEYFSDIMDRVSQYLVSSGDWTGLLEVFALMQNGKDGTTTAKYAYTIARAVMEGFILPEAVTDTAETYFRIAFEKSGKSFYYRALSASFLGEEVNPLSEKSESNIKTLISNKDELEFLLNFFEFGAGSFAYAYFRDLPLTINEQRIAARRFIQADNWYDAIRVCSVFMNREEYETRREDLEMFYPRPYAELIERNAAENQIPTEIFFGLIRTESAFNANISSWAGAVGLSQLLPDTALDMALRIARRGGPNYIEDGSIDLRNPEINVHIGAWYLNYLVEYTGSPVLALVAYNGGMGRVRRWRTAMPDLPEDIFLETIVYAETREYGRRVLGAAAAYGYLYYGMSMEAVIADIFKGKL